MSGLMTGCPRDDAVETSAEQGAQEPRRTVDGAERAVTDYLAALTRRDYASAYALVSEFDEKFFSSGPSAADGGRERYAAMMTANQLAWMSMVAKEAGATYTITRVRQEDNIAVAEISLQGLELPMTDVELLLSRSAAGWRVEQSKSVNLYMNDLRARELSRSR